MTTFKEIADRAIAHPEDMTYAQAYFDLVRIWRRMFGITSFTDDPDWQRIPVAWCSLAMRHVRLNR